MCLEIFKDAPKAIADAKKQKKMKKTVVVLVKTAIIFAVAGGIVVANTGLYSALLLSTVVSMFVTILVVELLLGFVFYVATVTLGGKGRYFEGLTAVTYAMLPIGVGMLISSLLAFLPFTGGLQLIVLALAFAFGLGVLYRGIKELYSVDMVTALVAVSVSILALLMAVYASVGLSLLTNVAALPVV